MDKIHELTGIDHRTQLRGFLVAGVLFVMFGVGQVYITCIIGVLYPTLMSFIALETKDNDDDDKQWLTYWVIFGMFNIID